ncbi:MAG TPA: hypothetical protein VF546_20350 [Pyrinomonadaceae bacterium]
MILYYAMGGGLGHLTRARAVLHTLRLTERATLLTASPYADDPRVTGGLPVRKVPSGLAADVPAYRAWLARLLDELRPTALYLDTFPAGIRGELCDFPALARLPVHYLARLLRWAEYAKLITNAPVRLQTTYVLEPLAPAHAAFVARHSARSVPLTLREPPRTATDEAARVLVEPLTRDGRTFWLVVHSAPCAEVAELVAYADELRRLEQPEARLVLLTRAAPPALPAAVRRLDFYPAAALFPFAARVVSACGFNVMREMAAHRHKHRFMPFPRRFDDQFARAASHQLNGS